MTDKPIVCDTCHWWDTSVTSSDDRDDRTGRCARLAPSVDFRTGLGVWPITDQDDWCGQYEHRRGR